MTALTARDLIKRAARLHGAIATGDDPSSGELSDALISLNTMKRAQRQLAGSRGAPEGRRGQIRRGPEVCPGLEGTPPSSRRGGRTRRPTFKHAPRYAKCPLWVDSGLCLGTRERTLLRRVTPAPSRTDAPRPEIPRSISASERPDDVRQAPIGARCPRRRRRAGRPVSLPTLAGGARLATLRPASLVRARARTLRTR